MSNNYRLRITHPVGAARLPAAGTRPRRTRCWSSPSDASRGAHRAASSSTCAPPQSTCSTSAHLRASHAYALLTFGFTRASKNTLLHQTHESRIAELTETLGARGGGGRRGAPRSTRQHSLTPVSVATRQYNACASSQLRTLYCTSCPRATRRSLLDERTNSECSAVWHVVAAAVYTSVLCSHAHLHLPPRHKLT